MSLGKLVAIVDDEQDITTLFQDALTRSIEGISVVSFNDATLAFEHYKDNKQNYAMIISDMRMPVINGVQLLKTVKDLNPSARTILMTAYDLQDPEIEKLIENQTINKFLQKPIGLAVLLAEVNNQLHLYEQNKK